MRDANAVERMNGALQTAGMAARSVAAGLVLLRMNRSEDPGLTDDEYEAFCWGLEQSVMEVAEVLDMAMHMLRTQTEETAHDPAQR
ncbi:hypothetical protein [Methylococcus geothermalis]|uniref:ANTAR domain-containing protein n=1 Tax=Methylococcus geothermalis TaxID=2681310 RepID=A0A858Q8L1_9GAMM|nr:hypothetical protein [Methylococcus geothermalis]QJD30189.1 hypothetical protein GNH96_09540 [Methylococcus geothermalis]